MKASIYTIIAVTLLACPLSRAAVPVEHSIKYKGQERTYKLYIPDNLTENASLVIVLHGYGGHAMNDGKAFCSIADKENFAVCYPQGAVDDKGKTCWNVGYPFQDGLKTDDVGFLCRLARHLQKEYRLSRANTFLTGMSNGGEMCYLMAYLKPDFFGAIASIAGLTLEWMQKDLEAKGPVPFMEVHGTSDHVSEWNGDPENEGGWGEYIAVPVAVGKWVAEAGCTHEMTEKLPIKAAGTSKQDPKQVILHKYTGGKPAWKNGPKTEVWLYQVVGGDHSWSEHSLDTCDEVWKFFKMWKR